MANTHKDVKWKVESPDGLSQRMIDEDRITAKKSFRGEVVTLDLQCMICDGKWTTKVRLNLVRSFRRRADARAARLRVPLRCGCGERHDGAPDGVLGCGREFGVTVGQ